MWNWSGFNRQNTRFTEIEYIRERLVICNSLISQTNHPENNAEVNPGEGKKDMNQRFKCFASPELWRVSKKLNQESEAPEYT